jgi:hypothetical protein
MPTPDPRSYNANKTGLGHVRTVMAEEKTTTTGTDTITTSGAGMIIVNFHERAAVITKNRL